MPFIAYCSISHAVLHFVHTVHCTTRRNSELANEERKQKKTEQSQAIDFLFSELVQTHLDARSLVLTVRFR